MGTTYHIIAVVPKQKALPKEKLKQQIDLLLKKINQQMSTYQKNSEISQFNQYPKTDWFNVSHDFALVVASAQKVSQLSHGAFDISISPLINLWGFGSKPQTNIPSDKEISTLLQNTGYKHLSVRIQPPSLKKDLLPLSIDLSAIAKGFAVDKVNRYLIEQGYKNNLVEIGGEVKVSGKKSNKQNWTIAIEQPEKTLKAKRKINRIIPVSDTGIATSGDYRNYFIKDGVRFSHTIDPTTGKPITHKLASVTIFNDSCMIADAYATAVMVMGEVKGKIFITQNKIRANMIIRKGDKFTNWSK